MSQENYSLQENGSFVIRNYNQQSPFSNFLPGVAGIWGVPMWVFYINRGQGVSAFGINDKEHAIAEFFPANQAYAYTSQLGYRTFIKANGQCYEPFSIANSGNETMTVRSAGLSIEDTNSQMGLKVNVRYFTLPNTSVPGLVRAVTIKNISSNPVNLELMDGLAKVVPFGMIGFFMKEMSRTIEAWMRALTQDNGVSIFKLIVDAKDVSKTEYITGGNFSYAFYEDGGKKALPVAFVDPAAVFGNDTSFVRPNSYFASDFDPAAQQIGCGKTPCAFNYLKWQLNPGEEKTLYSVIGTVLKLDGLDDFLNGMTVKYLLDKERENEQLVEGLKSQALTVSNFKRFDDYVKCTYLDNVLRGGYPYKFSKGTYYVYSRKHGDLERDYNRFHLLPACFSEGEAKYRDINQNRRMDWFFSPNMGSENIEYFLSLLKIDGYNPLTVRGEKLFFNEKEAKAIANKFKIKSKSFVTLLTKGFHLGEAFGELAYEGISFEDKEALADTLVSNVKREPSAVFGEGFWIDHWHYNLDLIESYLYFYPENKSKLFTAKKYLFWDDEHHLKPRNARYTLRDGQVYQYHGLEAVASKRCLISRRKTHVSFLHTKYGKPYQVTLVEKLLGLVANKVATLDPDGIGIEMEADKPGWCDSLNGLPALFGSSLCETLETKRACQILIDGLKALMLEGHEEVVLGSELNSFVLGLDKLLDGYFAAKSKERDYKWWDSANCLKEKFRAATFADVSGVEKKVTVSKLIKILEKIVKKLDMAISRAKDKTTGVTLTYFRYDVKKFKVTKGMPMPLKFIRHNMPLFLEGPMYALKAQKDKAIYDNVKASPLYDQVLGMYRLNASLEKEPLDIGRSRIFVPGWLENESVWLHMEYKYLLETLKSGFYEEFYQDFQKACVCFFDPARYGRSILENSSFIVSSAYPDKQLWGKGFAARLSGATVELLNMWVWMVLGSQPFFVDGQGNLCMQFKPILKKDMFTVQKCNMEYDNKRVQIEENCFAFRMFANTLVVYHNNSRKDTYSVDSRVKKIVIAHEGKVTALDSSLICGSLVDFIRRGLAERIDVYFS